MTILCYGLWVEKVFRQSKEEDKRTMLWCKKRMSHLIVEKICPEAVIPKRATQASAGYDLCSTLYTVLAPRSRVIVTTGLRITIPADCYGRIAPRSSLSVKGIDVLAGVIDSDYRDEVKIILVNLGELEFIINPGDRVAQLILERIRTPPVLCVNDNIVYEDTDKERVGGFGSTNSSN
jgi:dUTP pyrophosphatase